MTAKTIVDLLLAEEARLLERVPCLDPDTVAEAGLDVARVWRECAEDPDKVAAYLHLAVPRYAADFIGAEEIAARHFEVVHAVDADGTAVVRLKAEVAERCRAEFPEVVDRTFVLFGDTDDERLDDDAPDGAYYACPRLWTLTADGTAVERQDAVEFRLHPDAGLGVRARWVGGPLSERVLDAVWMKALGGNRASRLDAGDGCLRVLATTGFLLRFPEHRDPDCAIDAGRTLDWIQGRAKFPMTRLAA